MKKSLLICMFMVTFTCFSAFADVTAAKKEVSKELNSTVKELKSNFKTVNDQVNNSSSDITNLKGLADDLLRDGKDGERNATILEHGRATLKPCSDYSRQNLVWRSTSENGLKVGKWACETFNPKVDCEPVDGEVSLDGKCVQHGNYRVKQRWTSCIKATERKIENDCHFTNSVSGKTYQVKSGCSSQPTRYKQACGNNGAYSSCKCPAGQFYANDGGAAGRCKAWVDHTYMTARTLKFNFCTDHFAKLKFVKDGYYVEVLLEGQNPKSQTDARCNHGQYSSSWLYSKGLNGAAPGAFMRVTRIYVGPGFNDLGKFRYSYSSWGSGCHAKSGSGVGPAHGNSLTNCPGYSAQWPTIHLHLQAVTGKVVADRGEAPKCKL